MNREDVYKLIDGERDYQYSRWEDRLDADGLTDKDKSIADWVVYLDWLANKAKDEIYMLRPETAKEMVRKIAAVAVACMENNETNPRKESK